LYIRYSYKSYKESKLATGLSLIGGIFNAFGKIALIYIVIAAIGVSFKSNAADKKYIYSHAIYFIIGAGILFLIGFIFNSIAKKVVIKVIRKRLDLSCQEIDELVSKKPKLKEWFIENHPQYKVLHSTQGFSENGTDKGYSENGEKRGTIKNENLSRNNKKRSIMTIFGAVIGVFVMFAIIFVIGHKDSITDINSIKEAFNAVPSSSEDEKYECYVDFNNDVVSCYQMSIDPYLKDKGMEEEIHDKREPEKVQMTPIIDAKYKTIDKVKEAVNKKPKMDIDQDADKLADATQKMYDLIGQIYYVYGGQQFTKETDKSKEQLHKEFLAAVKEYDALFDEFTLKLDTLEVGHTKKQLEQYKKKNDMDSYHTLNVLMNTRRIYNYFIENDITNDTFFDMNLDEYNKLLDDYNNAYAEFEKQDVKGKTVHTQSFKDFSKAYSGLVNNIPNMVQKKTLKVGDVGAKKGLVGPSGDDDIQEKLYFYFDRLTSSYNSIQGFKGF
jgi:hypothetical protein